MYLNTAVMEQPTNQSVIMSVRVAYFNPANKDERVHEEVSYILRAVVVPSHPRVIQ